MQARAPGSVVWGVILHDSTPRLLISREYACVSSRNLRCSHTRSQRSLAFKLSLLSCIPHFWCTRSTRKIRISTRILLLAR